MTGESHNLGIVHHLTRQVYLLDRLSRWFDNFRNTIRAGYYAPAYPHKHDSNSRGGLPRRPWVLAGFGLTGLAGSLATDAIVTLAVGASAIGIAAGAGVAVVAAGAMFGALYLYSLKHSRQTISETNMAGQKVQGQRADLYTLHMAQKKIISLTEAFDDVAPLRVVAAEVQDVIKSTAEARTRVTILDSTDAPGHERDYEFVRPVVHFADAAAIVAPESAAKPARKPFRPKQVMAAKAA